MEFNSSNTDQHVLDELGRRIARHRLNRNMTQEALADQAGVSRPTVARLEQGRSTNVANLIRILRALNLIENLEALLPAPPSSPIQQLRTKRHERQRASSSRAAPTEPWRWGTSE